jgi:hypothetical protein
MRGHMRVVGRLIASHKASASACETKLVGLIGNLEG